MTALASFYFDIWYDRPTQVTLDVLSQAHVLDINDPIGKQLGVIYNGKNLSDLKKQLTVFVMRISNSGRTNIAASHFDPSNPFGYRIVHGEIAQPPETIAASRPELEAVQLTDAEGHAVTADYGAGELLNKVYLGPMLLDQGDFLIQKILVIHGDSEEPAIESVGRISGVKTIPVQTVPNESPSFWHQVFDGPVHVQVVRSLVYFVGSLLTIIAVVGAISGVRELWLNRAHKAIRAQRDKIISKYLATVPPTKFTEFAVDEYRTLGVWKLEWMTDEERIKAREKEERPARKEKLQEDREDPFMNIALRLKPEADVEVKRLLAFVKRHE